MNAPVKPEIGAAIDEAAWAHARRAALRRRVLLWAGPLLVAAACLAAWLAGGRYVGTEDAYVKAEKVVVSAEVSGPIASVEVRENQPVEAGQVLFRIDDQPWRIALAGAEAQLAAASTEFGTVQASYRQKTGELELAIADRDYAEREFTRQSVLAKQRLNSGSALDEATHALEVARRRVEVIGQERAQYLARLGGDPDLPVERFPPWLSARALRDRAALDLEHTVVRAPFAGIASKVPQKRQFAAAGAPMMSVVADRDAWIEANFMETDMTWIRVGQPVSIEIDAYPGRTWSGRVKSIAQATGSEFSILPPQNASGNWVKITQRIPVRIAVDDAGADTPLRAGMTATVEVDTGRRRTLPGLGGGPDAAPVASH